MIINLIIIQPIIIIIIHLILFIIKMLIQNNFKFNSIFIRGSKSYFLTLLLGNIYLRRWKQFLSFIIIFIIIIICIIIFKNDIKDLQLISLPFLIVSIVFKVNALSYARKLNMLENNLI